MLPALKLTMIAFLAAMILVIPAKHQSAKADIFGGIIGGALFGGLIGGGDGALGGAIMGGIVGGAVEASRRNRYYYNRNPYYRNRMSRRYNTYRAAPAYRGRGGKNARAAQARREKARRR